MKIEYLFDHILIVLYVIYKKKRRIHEPLSFSFASSALVISSLFYS
jgi:hypothetical protein